MTTSRPPDAPSADLRAEHWLACSREQEGLWLLDETRRVGAANNVVVGLELDGEPDFDALHHALDALVRRHEALRTEFAVHDGRLVRRTHAAARLQEDAVDRRVVQDLFAATAELAATPIDVLQWPPYRVALLSERSAQHMVLLVCHHCTFDGSSAAPLLRDLANLYAAIAEDRAPPRAPRIFDYAQHVAAERASLVDLEASARAHWEPALSALPDSLRIPERGVATGRAHVVEFAIDGGLKDGLIALGRRYQASLFVVLLASLQVLQRRYAGGGDEAVATAVAMDARPRGRTDLIGMFANEAPLLTRIRDERSFGDHLAAVNQGTLDLYKLRRFPFTEALARFSHSDRPHEAPVQVGVTYLRTGRAPIAMPQLEVVPRPLLANHGARRPVMLWLFDEPRDLRARLEHDTGLISSEVGAGMARHYVELLKSVVANPEAPLAALDLLTSEERRRVLSDWNATEGEQPLGTVHALVEAQVARDPRAPAVRFGDEMLSYEVLNGRANQLAHRLRRLGVGPDTRVGLCLRRSLDLVIGLLAILKAGGAYVPLDPAYPAERLQVMLEEARAPVLVTEECLEPTLAGVCAKPVLVDGHAQAITREPAGDPEPAAEPENLAYVIYTSGSTGVPKGVAMSHRSAANLLRWQASAFALREPVATLQFTSVGFDVAFQEIFSTLATGGCLELISEESRRDLGEIASVIAERGVQRIFVPFLALNAIAPYLLEIHDRCKRLEVITAGEQLEITPTIRRLFSQRPDWTLENQYGPTESHVVTAHRLAGAATAWPRLPSIGRPIANARIYILDRQMNPAPPGVPGEVYIGGTQVARGYLNRSKLTAELFVSDPFIKGGSRLYRSGDLARWSVDGSIEFLGRIDDQVKIRGHRVEPAEVRVMLAQSPDIREAAVVSCKDARGMQRLVAYVVPTEGAAPTPHELRARVAATLPDHMVPSVFLMLDALPLTRNGKLDRRALPTPDAAPERTPGYIAPRTEIESRLASIWSEVLGAGPIGVEDNFFELGGHSLLAAEVVARSVETFQREVPLRLLFVGPTIAELATGIAAAPRAPAGRMRIPAAARRRLADLVSDD